MRLLPDCTGKCIWWQIFGFAAIVYKISSLISLGCEVVNLMRIPEPASFATKASNAGKSIFSPLGRLNIYELTFCPNKVTSLNPLSFRSFNSLSMLSGSLLRSRPRV